MNRNLKKMWPAISLCLLTLATAAHADNPNMNNAQMRNLENRVNALEQRRGVSGVINPPARTQVKDGADLFATLDLLVWQARENGLALGVLSKASNRIVDGEVKNMHFEWNPGLRLGIGYNIPHDGWDLSLTWLRFYTTGHRKSHASSSEFIFPRFIHPGAPLADNECRTLHGHWKMHLNQLDLDLGREFFVSKWLTLRPHFGLRTDWINQRVTARYSKYVQNSSDSHRVKLKDEWWGIGLEGGLDTQWGLGCGWSIYGNLCAAILYGFHSLDQEDHQNTTQSTLSSFYDVKNSYHISHPVLDLQLGVAWDHMFCNDRFHLGIKTGWEHHVYFSQNQFMYLTDDVSWGTFISNQGDLTMEGWTLSARFDF